MRALLLHVGADVLAVPLTVAREVVEGPTLAAVPTAAPAVAGVFNLRGDIVPVFDAGVLLGLAPLPTVSHVVVVETALGPAGLAMSEVGATVDLGAPLGGTDTEGTLGTYAHGLEVVVLIDVEILLAPARGAV